MEVRNEELRSTREVAREISACLDALNAGDVEKIVITKNGKFAGVLITPERFDELNPPPSKPCIRCGGQFGAGGHGPGFCIDRREEADKISPPTD
jgi:hypothetical protein